MRKLKMRNCMPIAGKEEENGRGSMRKALGSIRQLA